MASSIAPEASQLPSTCETQCRPRCEFPPEIWGDRLASIPFDQHKLDWYDTEVEMLKSRVADMLKDTAGDKVERMKLFNLLYRLGISYHFEAEIERQMHQIFDRHYDLLEKKDYDLHTVATVFRIFRQHGIKMTCDIFNKFKDVEKGNFKDSLTNDPKGLLSLFEASHLCTRGEDILEEALAFTRTHLEVLAQSNPELADEITSSLTAPLHKTPPRLKAKEFISFYEKHHHEPWNDALLKFAKIDFNRVQLLHQQELRSLYKWSKEQDLISKLPFARDRIMEFFFWSETVYFEPKYAYARAEYVKQSNLVTFLDDVYDTYGKFEELPTLTDAMKRWDVGMMERLPRDYMKHLYKAYLDRFDDLENSAAQDGTSMCVSLTREYLLEFVGLCMQEVEWIKSGYIPSFEESLDIGIVSAGERLMNGLAFVGMGKLAVQAFQWVQRGPDLARAVSTIARLRNELVSYKRDEACGNATYPFCCYKRKYQASNEETVTEFLRRISDAWKTVNEELINESVEVPLEILMRVINFGRLMEVFYKDGDGITNGNFVESCIKTLYIDPIPI